jgi:PAS domain S-box-containing protein
VILAYPVINIYFIFPSFTRILIQNTEDVAENLAEHFSSIAVSKNELKKPADFADDAQKLKEEFNIERLRVFSDTGVIIYSSETEEVGEINRERYFNEIVARGNTFSKTVKKGTRSFEGRIIDADVVETYVPIMADGTFIGAIEIYYDITLKNKAITKTVFNYSIIPFSLMFLFLIAAITVLLRADRHIHVYEKDNFFINYLSPFYLLLITAISIFAVETVVMLFLSVFPPLSSAAVAILDSSLLIMIVSPVLFFFLVRPLRMHISKRKRVEDSLKESEEKYRSLVESTDDLIYLVDRDYRYLYMNKQILKRMGFSEDGFMGRAYSEFHTPEDSEKFIEECNRVFETGDPIRHEHKSQRDGTDFLRTFSPVKDEKGNTIAVNVISKDITEIKRYEEQLEESRENLRNLSIYLLDVREEERTYVAREIHDELGQSLTALKMDISLLGKRVSKDDKIVVEKIQLITKSINSAIQTVKKISSNLRPSVLDHFGLSAAIQWQVDEFIERTGIPCEVTIEPEDINLDKDRSTTIFRIFQETLTNIVRHSKATSVIMSLKEESESITLRVSDNGKGITEEQISNPRSFGLIGIGERVNSLNGEFTITGVPKKGTKITVVIPINNKENIDAKNSHS